MFYGSNFNDTDFHKFKAAEFNKTIDDPCALQQRANDNTKKLKFVTTNHIDLLEAKDRNNFFGIGVRDQLFVPGEKIDDYSSLLNGGSGHALTNCNVKNGFGQLPMPTVPSRYQLFHGDVDTEDKLRNYYEVNKNSCNPREHAVMLMLVMLMIS